jgi:uncharacterized RDD family membrane protein YckC
VCLDADEYWRQEVASRVQQHRARRRRRVDPNATMELNFASEALYAVPEAHAGLPMIEPAAMAPPTAMAQPAPVAAAWPRMVETEVVPEIEPPVVLLPDPDGPRPEPYKVIQFPRTLQEEADLEPGEPPEILELAEPVLDTPRILDAPEPEAAQIGMMQSFADIELEAEDPRECGDLPPMPAPLPLRFFAGLVDLLVMLAAGLVFAAVFLALATGLPPTRLLLPAVLASGALLWLVYQYAFLVHSAGTLGMRMAGLALYTFAGERASMTQRRFRALAAVLSAGSLGLGYFWAYVDEDTLCWHDRITATCVKEVRDKEDL